MHCDKAFLAGFKSSSFTRAIKLPPLVWAHILIANEALSKWNLKLTHDLKNI